MFVCKRAFSAFDQDLFASMSGDFNPMHMDAAAARRTQAGAPVVHGIHAVLWALDSLLLAGQITRPIAALNVEFRKFIYVDSDVELHVLRSSDMGLRAVLVSEGVTTTTIAVSLGSPAAASAAPLCANPTICDGPAALDLAEIGGLSGRFRAPIGDEAPRAFAPLAKAIGGYRVEFIANLSMLVGMICPGLHSIFSGFALEFTVETRRSSELRFAISSVDPRFRMVTMAVQGDGLGGTVTAFLRQPPVPQRSFRELQAIVRRDEFVDCNALVVGGSRGLGALTAKIIAAGGGRVVLTYASGEADAREVAREIGLAPSNVLRYDARSVSAPQLEAIAPDVNQLYYFATTHISRQKSATYSPSRFAEFTQVYVDGFADICAALKVISGGSIVAFYPSTVYVEGRPRDLTEYAMAKAAGEVLCADMNQFARGTTVLVKRLPRLLTDQTATIMPAENADPLTEILPIVSQMRLLSQRA